MFQLELVLNAVLTHGVALAQLERAVHHQHRCLVHYCYSYCYCVGVAVNGCYVCLLQTSGRRLVQDHERGDAAMTARLLKADREKSKVKKKCLFYDSLAFKMSCIIILASATILSRFFDVFS